MAKIHFETRGLAKTCIMAVHRSKGGKPVFCVFSGRPCLLEQSPIASLEPRVLIISNLLDRREQVLLLTVVDPVTMRAWVRG